MIPVDDRQLRFRFQHYRSLHAAEIAVGAGLTAIVGATDQGKTNIIRAIRDLFYGPRGTGLVEHGQKSATVEMTDGAVTVGFEKGTKTNRYFVASRDVAEFPNYGSEVPAPARLALGVREVEVDKGLTVRPSLSEQIGPDQSFLLLEPPSVIARVLGSVSGLHGVLAAQRAAAADLAAAQRSIKGLEAEEATTRTALDSAATARAALSVAKTRAAGLWRQHGVALSDAEAILGAIGRMNAADVRARTARAILARLRDVPKCAAGIADVRQHVARVDALARSRVSLMSAQKMRRTAIQGVDNARGIPDLAGKLAKVASAYSTADRLRCVADTWKAAAMKVDVQERRLKRMRAEEEAVEAELSAVNSCPLCGAAR